MVRGCGECRGGLCLQISIAAADVLTASKARFTRGNHVQRWARNVGTRASYQARGHGLVDSARSRLGVLVPAGRAPCREHAPIGILWRRVGIEDDAERYRQDAVAIAIAVV